jgi:hypothetical protein
VPLSVNGEAAACGDTGGMMMPGRQCRSSTTSRSKGISDRGSEQLGSEASTGVEGNNWGRRRVASDQLNDQGNDRVRRRMGE